MKLAIALTEILGQIHQRHIMHKDINPTNIVLNPITGQLKMIDFGISTMLPQENPTFRNPSILEGTLAYMSPEQTGRMNRVMDYRTDLYSLGVTFYELLTGQLPFLAADALVLIHAHIASQPRPPHVLKPEAPQTLSEVVLKLMAKNAEDRYQSTSGLKADLEECLRQSQEEASHWQVTQRIEPFPLGQQDVSDRFQIPQKLYGREQEIETLLAAFEQVSGEIRVDPLSGSRGGGQKEKETRLVSFSPHRSVMLLVTGAAGIGKTALVREVYPSLTRQRGYFIAGKFDQFQRNIPYAALIQAFRALIRQLLTESETEIAAWREKIQAAAGPNGQVIIEVVPEVELIIGPQPELPTLAPAASLNRFNLTFQNFIQVFTQPAHPLVIFLDDLQWADGASLKLIELLMTQGLASQHLFLMGAYRDNEVSEVHPLSLTIAAIKQTETTVNHICLTPLALPYVAQLLVDTLRRSPEHIGPLADLALTKTGGNPFFINQFLHALYEEKLDIVFKLCAWLD